MDVLLIGGSMRPVSHTGAVLREMATRLERRSITAWIWDVNEHRLPPADPAFSGRAGRHPLPEARRLGQLARRAHAFGVVSPVYHNSFSGVVKNALDYLTVADFRGKPVALASHGSLRSAVQGCDHLRQVVRGLHAVATVHQLASTDDDFAWTGSDYTISAAAVAKRLDDMVDELAQLAHLFVLARNPSLLEALAAKISAMANGVDPTADLRSIVRPSWGSVTGRPRPVEAADELGRNGTAAGSGALPSLSEDRR